MKRTVLLDTDTVVASAHDQVISLSPEVSYSLGARGVAYEVFSSLYDERDLRQDEDKYFSDQRQWFDAFDDFIRDHVSFCQRYGFSLATANYVRLKYVVDYIVMHAKILDAVFKRGLLGEGVVYVNRNLPPRGTSIFEFKAYHQSVWAQVLERFCHARGIPFEADIISPAVKDTKQQCSSGPRKYVRKQLKKLANFARYKDSAALFGGRKGNRQSSVLFMQAGAIEVDEAIRSCISEGCHTFIKEGEAVFQEDSLLRREVALSCPDRAWLEQITVECADCAQQLHKQVTLVDWVSQQAGVDVSPVILPILEQFVKVHGCIQLHDAQKFAGFYEREDIQVVVARSNTEAGVVGPLLAAQTRKETKAVCLQHASFALDMKAFAVFETAIYDYVLTREGLGQTYYESCLKNVYPSPCKAFQSPHYLKAVARAHGSHRSSGRIDTVVYVEKKFPDRVRCFNDMIYPLAWYFEFQKAVVDFFASGEGGRLMYKHSPGQRWAEKSLLPYIASLRNDAITVSHKHFLDVLGEANRVIVDFPSGALFEAAVCGKPVLCLCAEYLPVIEGAKDIFGKSLVTFRDIPDAIEAIKTFLSADPKEYIVKVPCNDESFSSVFARLRDDACVGASR